MNELNDELNEVLDDYSESTNTSNNDNINPSVQDEIIEEISEEVIESKAIEEISDEVNDEVEVKEENQETNQEAIKEVNENKQSKVKVKSKFKSSLLMILCFVLAFVGGLGGSALGNFLTKDDRKIIYQTIKHEVENVNSTNKALSINEIANIASTSVVEIKTETVSTSSFFREAISSGAGSGVILTQDGYIVTNHHVIEGANRISVTTKDGVVYEATLIGSDNASDLAVLKVEANDLKPATLGYSSELEVGDTAVAIGNPLGELGGTVTSGIISALDREITIDDQTMHLLQTNAAINPGNSGGGLFNDQGHLIGVVNAKSSGSDIEGLGFAIPIDKAKPIIESIMEHGYVKGRPSLGIAYQSSAAYDNSKANIYIVKINQGEAADKAGLEIGDQILSFGGEKIDSVSKLKDTIAKYKAGDQVEMKVLRDDEIVTVTITLDDASESSNNKPQEQEDVQTYPSQDYGFDDEQDLFEYFFGR